MAEETPDNVEDAGYGIGAASRRLGVPAPTLRTWNLRYGLGPSRRTAGGHRRYDATDLRRLAEMKRLIATGLGPAEAARLALALPAAPPGPPEPGEEAQPGTPPMGTPVTGTTGAPATGSSVTGSPVTGSPATGSSVTGSPVTGSPATGSSVTDAPATGSSVTGAGGRPATAALARAALMLDSHEVSGLIEETLAGHGVVWTWERLLLPVFDTICRRQDDTGAGIDVEHLLSDRTQAALHRIARGVPPHEGRPVLLACAEDEQHSLPVHALAAGLAEVGVQTRVLGARTPYAALAHAMRRLGPVVVFVWSQQAITGDTAPLAALPRLRPACEIVIGGLGWQGEPPAGVVRVSTLPEAIARIAATLG
ncbi:MerR family transcriptional regulator [Nonomuraea sp. MCN248]|uniref:MerR family transcriptional regulator n=1 Tax=Nonomuraea corallina TaxID=2989783 RepID=A0ABT4S4I1_9ACTN|nr:MerR family transcriptional regulator [Nonomuraea corallina]MDA0632113.1 MerR family transcriptional regulator [Nonomuraea corallina]